MQVEIWSDVVCPFCYIGKRRFEEALTEFEGKEAVEVIWKSFQLNPAQKTDPSVNITQHLADIKGWQLDYAKQLNNQVTQMAESVGLAYDFDSVVVANSFKAHRLIHLAAAYGLADAAEEELFKGYFTQGKNIDDDATLQQVGESIGLKKDEIQQTLAGSNFAEDVKQDINEARELGINGVPFFVIGGKYATSGAQPADVFLQSLRKAAEEGL